MTTEVSLLSADILPKHSTGRPVMVVRLLLKSSISNVRVAEESKRFSTNCCRSSELIEIKSLETNIRNNLQATKEKG